MEYDKFERFGNKLNKRLITKKEVSYLLFLRAEEKIGLYFPEECGDHFMRTSFYFEGQQRLGNGLGNGLGDRLGESRANLTYTRQRILELMEIDSRISIVKISQELGFSTTAIEKNIDWLKENGYLKRHGNAKSGYWEILK